MFHTLPSEDNVRMYDIHPLAERHEQRHLALRTVENCFSRLELQRSKSQKIEYFYDLQDRMLTYGDNTYTYTVNGSLLTKTNAEGVTEYSYDAMGNLLRVVLPDNRVITYQIDARGRRIGKKVDGVFEYGFIYGNQLNPIAKVDESGNIVEQYVYGLKSNIPEYMIKNGVKYKIISNHLGSPVEIAEASMGALPVLQIKYDSFGNIIEENGDFEIPFRFAGGIYDKDTKLTRFGVRDYDSETGRWTSKEPLGFNGSRNFYVYAGNDGVNHVDLDGLFWNPYEKIGNWYGGLIYDSVQFLKHYGVKGVNSLNKFKNEIQNKLDDLVENLVCSKDDDSQCKDQISPEDVMGWSNRIPKEEEKGKHEEYRGRGGELGVRLDFYLLTEIYIQDLNRSLTGKACDGSRVNYHRAHNSITPSMPTIQIMHRPNKKKDVKIRYEENK